MPAHFVTALPVYNEQAHVEGVLREVLRYSRDVLVVDDGSTDATPELLRKLPQVQVLRHPENLGYGAALKSAFRYAIDHGYEVLVTIDCDGQHQPALIPTFLEALGDTDIVSGSRYLEAIPAEARPPEERRHINRLITEELNRRLGLNLTDAFCGFKAYRVRALERLELMENGYAMPLELWVQAVYRGLRIKEMPVPLLYLEEERSFGGALDDAQTRLEHYRACIQRALARVHGPPRRSPSSQRADPRATHEEFPGYSANFCEKTQP